MGQTIYLIPFALYFPTKCCNTTTDKKKFRRSEAFIVQVFDLAGLKHAGDTQVFGGRCGDDDGSEAEARARSRRSGGEYDGAGSEVPRIVQGIAPVDEGMRRGALDHPKGLRPAVTAATATATAAAAAATADANRSFFQRRRELCKRCLFGKEGGEHSEESQAKMVKLHYHTYVVAWFVRIRNDSICKYNRRV